jgi:hypothetical protein
MDAQTKVSRAITQLAFKKETCFYGSILLSVGVRRNDRHRLPCVLMAHAWSGAGISPIA